MTEEIIIDCAFYKDGVCASPINKTCEYCKNIEVSKCYHKQLKRLEQENRELKEKYTHVLELAKTNADSNEYCLQELEQENKELKERLNGYLNSYGELYGTTNTLAFEHAKYKSALEEIRDYCKFNFVSANPILDKINEVLNG